MCSDLLIDLRMDTSRPVGQLVPLRNSVFPEDTTQIVVYLLVIVELGTLALRRRMGRALAAKGFATWSFRSITSSSSKR